MKRLLAALLLTIALCGCPVQSPQPGPGPEPKPEPTPEPIPVITVSPEMQQIVSPIVPISDEALSQFYAEFAEIVGRDSEILKSTEHIRTAHSRAGQLMFQRTGMQGKHPGLAGQVDKAIADAIGLDHVSLTPELRGRAVEIFKALSWACE